MMVTQILIVLLILCFGEITLASISSIENFEHQLGDTLTHVTREVFPCPAVGCSPTLAFLNLHENENTSVVAVRSFLYSNGGSLVKFAIGNNRVVSFKIGNNKYSFDPNRMFTPEGIQDTLATYSKYTAEAASEVTKFAARVLEIYDFDNQATILAMHNNAGTYGAQSYLPGQVYEKDAEKVNIGDGHPSNFYYVVDNYFFDTFAKGGYSVVLQNNDTVTNDGSLSYYTGLKGKAYVNFEAIAESTSFGQQVIMQLDMIYAASNAIRNQFRKTG